MSEERVYVIGTPGSSTVKIGRTIDLKKRLAEIQRMSPVRLEVLWSTPGGHELETALHRHFRSIRSHGEWFEFEDNPASLVQRAAEDKPWAADGALTEAAGGKVPQRAAAKPTRDMAVVSAALAELDELTRTYHEIKAERDQARAELHEYIVYLLRERKARPGEVAERTPYDRVHVGRIAKEAGVPPLRKVARIA